jgi:anaerobic ribonucleoside-triphosphate reductase activating protein
MELTPEAIIDQLDLESIQGLTFSGGEPMQQAAGLAALIRLARQRKELNLICFTGYRYERLVQNPPNPGVPELLAEVDVLIDGPYIRDLNDSVGLRGSSNQRVIHLTTKLEEYEFEAQARNVEITIAHREVSLVGIPTPGILSALEQAGLAGTGGRTL